MLTPVRAERGAYLPVDADVSPMDNSKSHKEGVGRTYKGTDGYAPNLAYVGQEGYMINCLLLPEIQVDTYWTGLEEYPETVIELYHAHGTSEQFHSELKSDMGVERLPSGKFKTNSTLLQAAKVAYNTLRKIGQLALLVVKETTEKVVVSRWRLRTVLQNIMYLACKFVERSRRHFVKFNQESPWLRAIEVLYARL